MGSIFSKAQTGQAQESQTLSRRSYSKALRATQLSAAVNPPRKPTLRELFAKHKTDKGSAHGYDRFYDPLFEKLQDRPVSLLEIGVNWGASLRCWEEYFTHPGSKIFGVAYDNKPAAEPSGAGAGGGKRTFGDVKRSFSQRCIIYLGDQSDEEFLHHLASDSGGHFDIVIDDGSHLPSHQVTSLETLWPHLKPGGLYIVEDIETSFLAPGSEIYGYSLRGQPSFVEYSQSLVDASVNQRAL